MHVLNIISIRLWELKEWSSVEESHHATYRSLESSIANSSRPTISMVCHPHTSRNTNPCDTICKWCLQNIGRLGASNTAILVLHLSISSILSSFPFFSALNLTLWNFPMNTGVDNARIIRHLDLNTSKNTKGQHVKLTIHSEAAYLFALFQGDLTPPSTQSLTHSVNSTLFR